MRSGWRVKTKLCKPGCRLLRQIFDFIIEEKICHEALPLLDCNFGSCSPGSGVGASAALDSAWFIRLEWNHVIGRGSRATGNISPAFDVRAKPRTSPERSEVVGTEFELSRPARR